jgi:hypothetical protein
MPRLTTVIATGPALTATVAAQRTEHGVEEIDHVVIGIGSPGEKEFARLRTELADVLRRLAGTGMPLVALQLVRRGRRDLSVPPSLLPPPIPLILFLGAPAVRGFGLDVAGMRDRYGAEQVGRPRLPALLFDLGPVGFEAWQQLDRILGSLNPELLTESLGLGAESLARLRAEAPPDTEGGADA